MPHYDKPPKDAPSMVKELIKTVHTELAEAEVKVAVLSVLPSGSSDKKQTPAIKHQGYPAIALIKINSVRDRAEGKADATILVDAKKWEEMTETQRRAVIDHELTHLQVVRDDQGHVESDDQGRPKLKMRLHDWQIGGFAEVANRNKAAAPEVMQAKAFNEEFMQTFFAWG